MNPLNENFVLKGHSESRECRSRLLWYFSVSGCTVIANQDKRADVKQNIYLKTHDKNKGSMFDVCSNKIQANVLSFLTLADS